MNNNILLKTDNSAIELLAELQCRKLATDYKVTRFSYYILWVIQSFIFLIGFNNHSIWLVCPIIGLFLFIGYFHMKRYRDSVESVAHRKSVRKM